MQRQSRTSRAEALAARKARQNGALATPKVSVPGSVAENAFPTPPNAMYATPARKPESMRHRVLTGGRKTSGKIDESTSFFQDTPRVSSTGNSFMQSPTLEKARKRNEQLLLERDKKQDIKESGARNASVFEHLTQIFQLFVDIPGQVLSLLEDLFEVDVDSLGYAYGAILHALHLLVSVASGVVSLTSGRSKNAAVSRLQALQRAASFHWLTAFSWFLVFVSVANMYYLISRRRTYQFMHKTEPLNSANARLGSLDLSSPPSLISVIFRYTLRGLCLAAAFVFGFSWTPSTRREDDNLIQELDVWVPEQHVWSLRLSILYSPAIALLYHFLTPSRVVPFVAIGSLVIAQSWLFSSLYATLVHDQHLIQAEVMKEYNAKYVNPRVFWNKVDVAVDTSDLEYYQYYRRYA